MYGFLRFPEFRIKALTFSYDDGGVCDTKFVSILNEYGMKGTFNLNSGTFGHNETKLTEDECLKLFKDSGHEVAIHGEFHKSLTDLDPTAATREILNDRLYLEKIFDERIFGIAYACNDYNDKVIEIAKNCGIKYARTTKSTEDINLPEDFMRWHPTCHHSNKKLMEIAETFMLRQNYWYYWFNKPRLMYVWGHANEFRATNSWDEFEKFAEYVGNKDDVWYATNGEIFSYVQAYNRLEYSADGETIYNPSVIDVYLCYYGNNVLVKAGQSVKAKNGVPENPSIKVYKHI